MPSAIQVEVEVLESTTKPTNPLDAFHRLVQDLSNVLGPSSGLDSKEVDLKSLEELMRNYCSNESEWKRYAMKDPSLTFTRNLVDRGNGKSNLLILVWTPGKESPIHDHANAHCVMKILRGSLKETLYNWPDRNAVSEGKPSPLHILKETVYTQNQVNYMSDSLGLHKISNPNPDQFAVSLHCFTLRFLLPDQTLLQPHASTGKTASAQTTKPLPPSTEFSHPIHQLIDKAEKDFEELKKRQSQTLEDAVEEYRRRYKIPPPPSFDKWYEFARAKRVQLIDEFDTIHHSLLPFWALPPSVIRGRAREALGFDNALLGILIRDGKVVSAAGGGEWQQKSTIGMVENFVKYLPDMDLPFNVHDEPRVIVPHDDLSRLVARARDLTMPAAFNNTTPRNLWSPRPADVDDGTRFNEFKTTRFNKFAHQPTWTNSRVSCSPESPARALEENPKDDPSSFSFSELGFISNKTALSDICLSPSLRERFGFFNRPNAYNIVHDLFPIFSQSKISSYQDILYPSPWYWSEKVAYQEEQDHEWEKKHEKMYWRGSTTGGFSRDGGWRHQHRQLFVEQINALGTAKAFEENATEWKAKEVPRPDYKDLFDVKFSHIGQCDPSDCDAQREFFEVVKPAKQHEAWAYKYLLDMDGNAFSGRFYAFLKSRSLVYKMAVFREWHEEWLRPWVHYIPLSLKGDEYVESVRYFKNEETGRMQAPRIATRGREWAGSVLRNDDLEVWLFRVLIEYGRLVDDNREVIGYGAV